MKSYTLEELALVYLAKQEYFESGKTLSYKSRILALQKLKKIISDNSEAFIEALYLDMKKPRMESIIAEISVVIEEINAAIKGLKSWMGKHYVDTPITIAPGVSYFTYQPKGIVLIFSPWNYPISLCITPLIGAIASGNSVIVKPAHETPISSKLLHDLLNQNFDQGLLSIVTGHGETMGNLLLDNFVFHHIFYTGSSRVGKWIFEKASKHLTPVTLELGGKSPAIVDANTNIKIAAKRIAWGKFFNSGQTCLSVDYAVVHADVVEKFIYNLKSYILEWFGEDPQKSPNYGRIINNSRFDIVIKYLEDGHILHGGNVDRDDNYIEPTILHVEDCNKPIMNNEIFGPILPIIVWTKEDELFDILKKNPYPLSCYFFTKTDALIHRISSRFSFGGGVVNNVFLHFGNNKLPFGGVITSGLGRYHGFYSFKEFSIIQPIVRSFDWIDPHIWYPPYTSWKEKLLRLFVK